MSRIRVHQIFEEIQLQYFKHVRIEEGSSIYRAALADDCEPSKIFRVARPKSMIAMGLGEVL